MIRTSLIASALALLALQAQATTTTLTFSSDPFDLGPLAGKSLSGQFSFDDATLTTDPSGTAWTTLTSLSFTLDSSVYTVSGSALAASSVNFDAATNTLLGMETVVPLNGGFTLAAVRAFDSFYPAYALYTNAKGDYLGSANLTYAAAVPEPGTWALLVGGLGVVSVIARRRQA